MCGFKCARDKSDWGQSTLEENGCVSCRKKTIIVQKEKVAEMKRRTHKETLFYLKNSSTRRMEKKKKMR
jgi:hypothetical protein